MSSFVRTTPQAKRLFNSIGPSGSSAGIEGATSFNVAGLNNGSGFRSDVYDLGSGVRDNLFEWRANTKTQTNPTLGGTVEIYLCSSDDGFVFDGNLSSGGGATNPLDKRRNLQYVGAVQADVAASGTLFVASGPVVVNARYVAVAWWNLTGANLSSTPTDHSFSLVANTDTIV